MVAYFFNEISDGNFIESIESLSFINAEKLQILSVSENRISNANIIAKCKFSDLSHLNL